MDALGKFPTGIAEGSFAHFGEFDECLEIEHYDQNDESKTIYGRYCLAKIIIIHKFSKGRGECYFIIHFIIHLIMMMIMN